MLRKSNEQIRTQTFPREGGAEDIPMQLRPQQDDRLEEGCNPDAVGAGLGGQKARAKLPRRHSSRRPSMREAQAPSPPIASATAANCGTNEARAKSAERKQENQSHSRRTFHVYGAELKDIAANEKGEPGTKPAEAIHRDQSYSRYAHNDVDYEQKYAPDPYGEELGAKARVWSVYNDEAQMADAEVVKGMNGTLDVLLVFAGLFSAVVTTFVAQSSQALASDYTQITASLMYELVRLQRAMANGTPVDDVPMSRLSFDSRTHANTDVWVNGLWLTSLTFSLLTAFISVLAKQWLQHFNSMATGTPRDHALLRQYRLRGFERWNVSFIIGFLPVLLILALFLFFAGLSVYVAPLNHTIFWTIISVSAISFLAYVLASILPIFIIHCAYKTPISDYILAFPHLMLFIFRNTSYYAQRIFVSLGLSLVPKKLPFYSELQFRQRVLLRLVPSRKYRTPTLKHREAFDAKQHRTSLIPESLRWLYLSSSGPSAPRIVAQASSATPLDYKQPFEFWKWSISDLAHDLLETLDQECAASKELVTRNAHLAERLGRTALHVSYKLDEELKLWDDLYTCRDQVMSPQLNALLCTVLLQRWSSSLPHAVPPEGVLSTADMTMLLSPTSDLELHPTAWSALAWRVRSAARGVLRRRHELPLDLPTIRAFAGGLCSLMSNMWQSMDQDRSLDDEQPLRSLSSFDYTTMTFHEYYQAWCAENEEEASNDKKGFKQLMDGLKRFLDTLPADEPSAETTSALLAFRNSTDSSIVRSSTASFAAEPAPPSSEDELTLPWSEADICV
ncbi:hypothetical protein BD626DRAFT_565777 [Schizophyllum amplum]|uniref:DUF6535 domain-containing protein n=1 Tax=Schizophyllum amplum TaxID=97359 RepID=A0A550CPH3_9AGAR|nr:hypothetical protein BD626DRAFT_565777 [Auriculariopsis ampla]